MSRVEYPSSVNKLKQIPRIFQNHRKFYPIRTEASIVDIVSDTDNPRFHSVRPNEIYQENKQKDKQNTIKINSICKSDRVWNLSSEESVKINDNDIPGENTISGNIGDVETVANIEQWLKTRTESVSSVDLDIIKSEVGEEGEEDVDRYLADELPHTFLEKDPDTLSMDIDLSDKKLNLCYDPLQELQNAKLLEEKDNEFILPEFRLDHLHPLVLSPDDMMVASEILPPTNIQTTVSNEQIGQGSQMKPSLSIARKEQIITHQIANGSEKQFKSKHKASKKLIKKSQRRLNSENYVNNREGVMTVVAISTDKISNTTQIIIDTNGEKQIFESKTSELIEATGTLPMLSKIENSSSWKNNIHRKTHKIVENHHEMIISEALIDLGITDDSLKPTLITDHGKVWLCPREDCNRQFNKLYSYKSHLLAHYGVRPFKCDYEGCAWAFYSEFKLKRHKETHLKNKNYVCEVNGCNRRFTTIYNLWSHEKLHNRPNRIVCHVPQCQEKFQTKRALELHMKTHDQSHAPYICKHEGCGKRYYSSNALTSHQRCHSYKEIDIKCSWPGCGKVFDKPCRLKAHTRSHTGYKPYSCTYQGCQWAFSSSSKLKRHQKKHTNERKFVCDILSCGKAFMRSEHLKEHKLTHTEGRYFQCYICDARFSAKSSLYVHIKKHQNKQTPNENSQSKIKESIKNIKFERNSERLFEMDEMEPDHDQSLTMENDELDQKQCIDPLEDMNYVFYTSSESQSDDRMIMVTPCDTVILNGTSNSDASLPEPEPPPSPLSITATKNSNSSCIQSKKDQGSARTDLTFSDVWKLKTSSTSSGSAAVGACDVVLSQADLGGLMLTEELPSLYYQDDVVGGEYQVLLLDSGRSESPMNL